MDAHSEYSPQASLVLIGQFINRWQLWRLIEKRVCIAQKTVVHAPTSKLLDAWLVMLTGGHGVVEANTRVRPDRMLQLVFGRSHCAEQSTISRTLSACDATTVEQLRGCVKQILRQRGRAYAHRYRQRCQLLDVDMTGLPAGRQAEGSTKGYFSHARGQRGRQLGRVLATLYDEHIVEQLYPGKRQLEHSFQPLVLAAEDLLHLTAARRKRTILRVDGGGGNDANVKWALARGYQLLVKVHNWQRADRLAASVKRWYPDPKLAERQVGWVTTPVDYGRPTRQLAVRYPQPKPTARSAWRYAVIVTTLTDRELFKLCRQTPPARISARARLLASLYAYDLREGGVETQNRSDKQGLGLSRRNKAVFAAQEVLVLLAQLAHNAVIWSRNHLAASSPRFAAFGVKRMVRDVFQIDGCVSLSRSGRIRAVELNPHHPYAAEVQSAFRDDM
jgi:hypothetical protein